LLINVLSRIFVGVGRNRILNLARFWQSTSWYSTLKFYDRFCETIFAVFFRG